MRDKLKSGWKERGTELWGGKEIWDARNAYDRTSFYLLGAKHAEENPSPDNDGQPGRFTRRLTRAMHDTIIARYELVSEVVLELRDFRLDKALSDRIGAR